MRNATKDNERVEDLARQVIVKACACGLTLVTAESCTGGAVAMHLSEALSKACDRQAAEDAAYRRVDELRGKVDPVRALSRNPSGQTRCT
jgi:hypothetical protein